MTKFRQIILFLFIFISITSKITFSMEDIWCNLKIKLKLKNIHEKTYWQGNEKIKWKEEIKRWHFGFLPRDESLHPLVIFRENFYPLEKTFSYRFRWMQNNAKILVINPLAIAIKTKFILEALSYKRERRLEVIINRERKNTFVIPKDEKKRQFKKIIIKNVFLSPGVNEIIFYTPEGTDTINSNVLEKKKVSIKFKDNFKFEIEKKIDSVNLVKAPKYKYVISNRNLQLIFREKGDLFLLSRDLDVDLQEYPYFNFDFELGNSIKQDFEIFLGIDYSGDNRIDGYLNLEELNDVHLFKLAKDKWQNVNYFKYGFRLRKIVLIFYNYNKDKEIFFSCVFLKNLQFYTENSIFVPLWFKKGLDLKKIIKVNNLEYEVICDDDIFLISAYFDSKIVGIRSNRIKEELRVILKNDKVLTGEVEYQDKEKIKLKNVQELEGKEVILNKDVISYYYLTTPIQQKKLLEEEYILLEIPFKANFPNQENEFILTYKLDDPTVQEIEIFFDLDKDGDGKIDERILAGREEIIRGWRFIGTKKSMDFYETYLSEKFPQAYNSTEQVRSKFVVYKNNVPLKLTWKKWLENIELAEIGSSPRKIVISLPQGETPYGNEYSILYQPFPEGSSIYEGFNQLKISINSFLKKQIKKVIIKLKRKEDVEVKGWFKFYIKEIGVYKKFTYPVRTGKEEIFKILSQLNIPLLKLDDLIIKINDFNWQEFENFKKIILSKRIKLRKGKHIYKKLNNSVFYIEWIIVEPTDRDNSLSIEPQIIFKKINPTKYLVKVKGAKAPFWLVFSESFHTQWRLYKLEKKGEDLEIVEDIVADYPRLKVKEMRHSMRFTFQDIKYLFLKPLKTKHFLINGYANGWYIEPERLGVGEDFTLVIYFLPQSLFYLGLIISEATFIIVSLYLIIKKYNR